MYRRSYNKYGAKDVVIQGIRFQSTGEGDRYLYLKECERTGKIHGLQLQVPYVLLEPIYERKTITRGPRKGQTVNGRLIMDGVKYVADFVYTLPDGRSVVEDFKGVETAVFKLKRRLAHEKGIDIKVVKRPCEAV